MARSFVCKWTPALLAALTLGMTGAVWSAGGIYDEEDPFDEARRFEHFQDLGGDLAEEQDVEFTFRFSDRIETRAEHARKFANKLKHRGYPQAEALPCAREEACWLVIAPKRMRLELRRNIALSKELDQLAVDDYGRYVGWDCALFKRDEQKLLDSMVARSTQVPTLGVMLLSLDQYMGFQCTRLRERMAPAESAAEAGANRLHALVARGAIDMMCTCVPARLNDVRLALHELERDSPISETELMQSYVMPKIYQPCAATMVRELYGADCPALTAERELKETYCGCMKQLVDETSEADLAQLGLIAADHLPKALQAQKAGTLPPDPPPLYAKFIASEAACRK